MKQCLQCLEEKASTSFYTKATNPDGLSDLCRKCMKAKRKDASPSDYMQEEQSDEEQSSTGNDFEKLLEIARKDPEYFNELSLETYEDYLKHNELIRRLRMRLRKSRSDEKSQLAYRYCPLEKIPSTKIYLTRTVNRGQPIRLNLRRPGMACWLQREYKDGEEAILPNCMIPEILKLAEAKYKQVKYPDGTGETVFDYWDNKYNCNPVM